MTLQERPSAHKPRLGRGLSSLISNSAQGHNPIDDRQYVQEPPIARAPEAAPAPANPVAPTEVPIEKIVPNPYQPRKDFVEEQIAELVQSILQQGILQPLLVAQANGPQGGYTLIAGERRLRAATRAGLKTVPCVVRQATPQQMMEWALVENIQRSDLNPMERAEAYRQYVDRFGLSHTQAAERLGQARTTVTNFMRLLELESQVQAMVSRGELSFGHAKVLAGLIGQSDKQVAVAQEVVKSGLSVRQLEEMITGEDAAQAVAPRKLTIRPAYVRDLEERLTAAIGTRVQILPGRSKNTGRIVVEYYNLEDFDRISDKLGLPAESESM